MPVEYLIFDLDDTLCDYQTAKKNAIRRIDRELEQYDIDGEVFWSTYEKVESVLETKLVDAQIGWAEYRERRFYDTLKTMCEKPEVIAERLDDIFMHEGSVNIKLFDDALPALSRLKAQGVMPAVLSNGFSDGQRQKIKSLALDEHISHIYISEELGVSKPHKLIFDLVLKNLDTQASKVLMIGDSIEHDFIGARKTDIRFVLIDRFNKHPNFEHDKIQTLADIDGLLPPGNSTCS